jgi:hypothetical protein
MYKPLKIKPDLICDNCGRFGAFDLGDQHLCSDCYMECGSCCMEFGGYDLWESESKKKDNTEKNDLERKD